MKKVSGREGYELRAGGKWTCDPERRDKRNRLRIMGAMFLTIGDGTRKSSKGGGRESRYVGVNSASNLR